MEDIQKRIAAIEKEMQDTPYHKGTEHYIGLLRARLAKLKEQVVERGSSKGGGGRGFAVKKHGDATVVLVGFPSVGKSTLLNKLTNANSKEAEYAFTTVTVIPGMMNYKGARIQILDVPGLIEGAAEGKGRGREVLSVVRSADLLLILASSGHEKDFKKITDELYGNGVRINQVKPQVEVQKSATGGLVINSSVKQDLDRETIEDICKEFRLGHSQINIKEKLTLDRLVDSFVTNRIFTPALFVQSKSDLNKKTVEEIDQVKVIKISATHNIGIDDLQEAIWERLGFVRVYLKNPFNDSQSYEPLIMNSKHTLKDVMRKIGTEFAENKKSAKIWGTGAKFPGQEVSLDTLVVDGIEVLFL